MAAGVRNRESSSRPWPSGVRIMAISTRWSPSPVTRPAHSPSIVARPSSSRPSSRKKSIVPPRSSTTIPTLSIRLSAMCPIYKVSSCLTTDRFRDSSLRTIWLLRLSPARWHTVYETEWKCGTHGGTMKAPYAKKWQNETDNLRKIVLDCDLVEELKWGKPCFTYQKKNLAIIIPLKDACALSFFKGALLKDPKHILKKIGEAQTGRWIKFTSPKEISALQPTLRSYIYEAIEVEESGKKVPLKKASEYVVPEELQIKLKEAPELKAAFEALTPGRRKSYIFHVSGAKQAKTRAARAEKCVPMILSGRGFNELPN